MFLYGGRPIVVYGLMAIIAAGFILPAAFRFQWGRPPHGPLRVYHTLPWLRLFVGAIGLWRLVVPWLTEGGSGNGWIWNTYLITLGALFGLPLLALASQRYEMRLDMRQRTYRLTQGWLLYTTVKSGTWEDFAGVFVQHNRVCSVGLAWNAQKGKCPILGRYYDPARAEPLAAEVAEAMDIPCVSAAEGPQLFIL